MVLSPPPPLCILMSPAERDETAFSMTRKKGINFGEVHRAKNGTERASLHCLDFFPPPPLLHAMYGTSYTQDRRKEEPFLF